MKFEMKVPGIKAFLLLALLGGPLAQAAETDPDTYIMVVYENLAHGDAILNGNPAKVIDKLAQRRNGRIADQVNLCVAYTKTRQIDEAIVHCDMALARSVREARRLRMNPMLDRRQASRIAATDKAIALTNRGVLHALVGESDEASDLFEMAMELDSTEKYAHNNLARLRSSPGGGDF